MAEHIVSSTIRIAANATVVWRALTEPAELIQWYAPGCRWEIPTLREGATVQFYNTETDVQRATIEVCTPLRELRLRWHPDEKLPGTSLLNTYTLTADGAATIVTVSQTGYASVPDDVRAAWIQADEGAIPAIATALAVFCGRAAT